MAMVIDKPNKYLLKCTCRECFAKQEITYLKESVIICGLTMRTCKFAVPLSCTFTTNVADELECDQRGEFDEYGFPVERCKKFPCTKYHELKRKVEEKAHDKTH